MILLALVFLGGSLLAVFTLGKQPLELMIGTLIGAAAVLSLIGIRVEIAKIADALDRVTVRVGKAVRDE